MRGTRNLESAEEGPRTLVARLRLDPERRVRTLSIGLSLLLGLLLTVTLGPGSGGSARDFDLPEAGRAATKDIIADRRISFVDEKATQLRIEAEERLVLPIYVIDERLSVAALERLGSFQRLVASLVDSGIVPDTLFLRVQSEFPGLFTKADIAGLSRFPFLSQVFLDSDAILRRFLESGVLSIPSTGLEHYNSDYVEIRRSRGGRPESVELEATAAQTLARLPRFLQAEAQSRRITRPALAFVGLVVGRFAVENAFFDADLSGRRLEAARRQVEPVVRTIAAGERVLRKGLVVTEADRERLAALRAALSRTDWGHLLGDSAVFLAIAFLCFLLLGPKTAGVELKDGEVALAAGGLLFTYALAVIAPRVLSLPLPLYVGMILPSALFCLVFAIFAGQRFALLYGLLLALLVLVASDYDSRAFAFTLFASMAAAFTIRDAESRMDLVMAGARLVLLEAGIAAILALPLAADAGGMLEPVVWAGANGFASATLALGLFPVLEQLLNAPTRFRLIELSDLNAPILKRLLAVAPGTYSHSVAVAHLAETACRDIGADALLARVGAYYHDIGKMEQPEYFVENQSGYNKHDEINPRLSATVIRSHVKLGVEKARALGLPSEVVDIVAQHHGNCLIQWFYDRASKEETVNPEDFSYPGQPPSSREAAVVMLADAAEAASRTIKKPTVARLESLLGDIVLDRVKKGQLERSDLTFRDLETIRASFTRILSGHFHARIEYPRIDDPRSRESER